MSSEPKRVREVLAGLGDVLGVGSPAEVAKVWAEWRGIVGPGIAAHADPTSLRAGVLRIRADSPTWATELGYLAGEITTRINRAVGTRLVREVKVWVGPRREPAQPADPKPEATPEKRPPVPPPADPEQALERARAAWAKSAARRSSDARPDPWSGPAQNPEKPR